MTTKRLVMTSITWICVVLGCEDPRACSSDEDCREGYRCDLEVYVGECVEVVRVVRCGDQLCRAPEVCVGGEGCRIIDRTGTQAGMRPPGGDQAGTLGGVQPGGQVGGQVSDQSGTQAGQSMMGGLSGDRAGANAGETSGREGGTAAGSSIQDMNVADMFRDPFERDQGGQICRSACDCTPGMACLEGVCNAMNDPVYCCEESFCPPDEVCETPSGVRDFCPVDGCQSACDCQPGLSCILGQCELGSAPLFCCDTGTCPSGMACETSRGVRSMCPSSACMTACDCDAGQRCVSGVCALEGNPLFCCESDPCPAGAICQSATGMASTCGATSTCVNACDCTPGLACEEGSCVVADTPVFCCDDGPCPIGSICEFSTGGVLSTCE